MDDTIDPNRRRLLQATTLAAAVERPEDNSLQSCPRPEGQAAVLPVWALRPADPLPAPPCSQNPQRAQ